MIRIPQEVNGREHAMRSQLEHGRAGARELRTQLKEGRRREEELRVANAMLTVRSSEIVEAVVAAAPKPMNASREGRNGGGGGRLPAGNGVRNGHNVELSGKEVRVHPSCRVRSVHVEGASPSAFGQQPRSGLQGSMSEECFRWC